jgi:hypothetical protein
MTVRRNVQPTDDERKAIVWDAIERLAFQPAKQETWLGLYAKTLHNMWDIEPNWSRLDVADQLMVPFLGLTCDYTLESAAKYEATISASERLLLALHFDPGYLSKAGLHTAPKQYPHQARDRSLRSDVQAVLDGMIFHTRAHSHLHDHGFAMWNANDDDESELLDLHEIRIGTGIENSYVFLFHLRYQFCLVSQDRRNLERERLVELFHNAIRTNAQTVSPRDLFNW